VIYLKSVLTGLAVAIASFLVYGILGVAVALGLGLSLPGVHVSPCHPPEAAASAPSRSTARLRWSLR
jgi:hypothetical protein